MQILVHPSYPREFVVTKSGRLLDGSLFFLDFSRPLERLRRYRIGPTAALLVPVVHESETSGGYVIGVDRGSPYFSEIETLWAKNSPRKWAPPRAPMDDLHIIRSFGLHFPEDAQ